MASEQFQDLFAAADAEHLVVRPLAVRMRPRTLDEVVGQRQALRAGSPLRLLAEPAGVLNTSPSSVILSGPPGVGKTTLAHIVAQQSGRVFEELSAVTSGVKEVRAVLQRARERLVAHGQETVLFIDEVHRFSKSQQDALLPSVENRDVTFIAATTENPSFSVIKPLLSRSVVVKLEALSDEDIHAVLVNAVRDERGLRGQVSVDDKALQAIERLAGGDARKALTVLEAAASAVEQTGAHVSADVVAQVMDSAMVRYDKEGDDHYDVASAFIKSMRGSDVDASLHYLARMIRAGEDPRFIARRIMIAAAEEVGLAAPQVLEVCVAAAQAVAMVGMPEARIILSEAVLAVATAPKSNASYQAINAALADVDAGRIGQVPLHLRNAPTALMKAWGYHQGYQYAHDAQDGIAAQQYLPDELVGVEYYHPKPRGYERELVGRVAQMRARLYPQQASAAHGAKVQNRVEQANVEQVNIERANVEEPTVEQSASAQPHAVQSHTVQSHTVQSHVDQSDAAQPATTAQPTSAQHQSAQPNAATPTAEQETSSSADNDSTRA